MKTREFKFSEIDRATYNPRIDLKPSDKEYQDIDSSLKEFGYLGGMVVNTRPKRPRLISGHQRTTILEANGYDRAMFATVNLDPTAEKRLNVILNKVGGRWSAPDLTSLLRELQANQVDLKGLGFTPVELNALLTGAPKATKRDPDDAPGAPDDKNAVTKGGDLYAITTDTCAHRLLCGDSTDPKHMAKLCATTKARMIYCDPPYGVSYTSKSKKQHAAIANDELRDVNLFNFLTASFATGAKHCIERAAFYTFYASRNHIEFETAMKHAGWMVKEQLIWAKQMVLGRSDYHWAHEPILYGCKIGQNCDWLGDRTETTLLERTDEQIAKMSKDDLVSALQAMKATTTIWDEKRDPASLYIHSTQKPVSLASRALRNSSMPGEHCLELFAGSGSTIIACELHGRHCLAMELSRGHCDAIIRRFAETFENATFTRNGKKFDPAKVGADS